MITCSRKLCQEMVHIGQLVYTVASEACGSSRASCHDLNLLSRDVHRISKLVAQFNNHCNRLTSSNFAPVMVQALCFIMNRSSKAHKWIPE